jgi:hypothetical protein
MRELAMSQRRGSEVPPDRQRSEGKTTTSSTDELVPRTEVGNLIAAEVGRLEEPSGWKLPAVYLEARAVPAYARSLGMPTVRSRLRRGLVMLRARLDDRFGGELGVGDVIPS